MLAARCKTSGTSGCAPSGGRAALKSSLSKGERRRREGKKQGWTLWMPCRRAYGSSTDSSLNAFKQDANLLHFSSLNLKFGLRLCFLFRCMLGLNLVKWPCLSIFLGQSVITLVFSLKPCCSQSYYKLKLTHFHWFFFSLWMWNVV